MTIQEIGRRLRLSTRTGRAHMKDARVAERTFRRWLSVGSPLVPALHLLNLARRLAEPEEPALVELEIDGERIVVLRAADYTALTGAKRPPLSPSRQILLAAHARHGIGLHSRD